MNVLFELAELRHDHTTHVILDGSRLDQTPPISHDETDQSPETRRLALSPCETTSDILTMVVDYANRMTQAAITRKHSRPAW
jgi:hypothetical protein